MYLQQPVLQISTQLADTLNDLVQDTDFKIQPHLELMIAWAYGAEIEMLAGSRWYPSINPSWIPDRAFRIKPVPHIHQELIDAYKAGAKIEFLNEITSWHDAITPTWSKDVKYRIKPVPPKPASINWDHVHPNYDMIEYYRGTGIWHLSSTTKNIQKTKASGHASFVAGESYETIYRPKG